MPSARSQGEPLTAAELIHHRVQYFKDLPKLPRGKGNKIINISTKKLATREEYVVGLAILNVKTSLIIQAGKRQLTLKPDDLTHYRGERGQRGHKLPKGYQKVDGFSLKG